MFAFGWLTRTVAFLALLAACSSLANAERLPLKSYTTADGLAHNAINKIVRDSRGFLWFCTDEGLSRYDGYTFTNFGVDQGLPHPGVTDFLETRSGELWVGTYRGLALFNPKGTPAGRIVYANDSTSAGTPMFSVVVPEDEDRLARFITVLFEDKQGTIWCGTMKHLYRLRRTSGRFDLIPIDVGVVGENPKQVSVSDLLEDRDGSLWLGSGHGLFRLQSDGRMEHFGKREGLPDESIHDILQDHQGRLWAATRNRGFFQFDPVRQGKGKFVLRKYALADGLPSNWVFQLFETSENRFWVATGGLVEFFPDSNRSDRPFHTYTTRNGLTFPEITAFIEDTGGNLWLGTNSAGAMRLARSGFITYDEDDGIATVNAIFEDATGGVCFRGRVLGDARKTVLEGAKLDLLRSTSDVYYQRFGCLDGNRFVSIKPAEPFEFGWFSEQVPVRTRDGHWWVGSNEGLYRFPASDNFAQIKTARPVAIYTTKDGLSGPLVIQLFADSQDNVWVSTIYGPNRLQRWDRAGQAVRDLTDSPGLPSFKDQQARVFAEDKAGNIWVGLITGVARYRDGHFTFFSTNEGLPPGTIMGIYPDRMGRLWLASARSGLIRVDDPNAERPTFTVYSTAQGLSSNSTVAVTGDLDDHIFVGTGRGLDQLDPASGRIKHFATSDGLAPGTIAAAFRDRRGVLWFGTRGGLSRFAPTITQSAPPPPILITGLNVAGAQRTVSALGETEIALPDLAPDRNQLQISFVALGFAPGEGLRYQYRLEGSGADWSTPGEQRTVNYASLSPGRYRFLVRAINSDGVESVTPAAVAFRVLRPVWQRWWFLSLAALVVALGTLALYRYRVERLLELERVRTRIATDLHDDIGAGLSRIAVLSEVARHESGSSPVGERLKVIAGASRELVDSMSDIVWVINPQRDQLYDLTQRMRRFASDVFTSRNFEFTFRAPGDEQHLKVSADVRRQLLLIFKEAVNNIIRHSGGTEADIGLSVANGAFILTVKDNGRGFDPAHAREGNGLRNMRRRASMMGGEFQVDSGNGSGTTIKITVPLKATVSELNDRLRGSR